MARKIPHRAVSFEQAKPDALANALGGARKLVVAIDVAKTKMMAGFELVMQTARLLDVQEVEAPLEPTVTRYGAPTRPRRASLHAQPHARARCRRGVRRRAQHA